LRRLLHGGGEALGQVGFEVLDGFLAKFHGATS
jgi:hypothetical protein